MWPDRRVRPAERPSERHLQPVVTAQVLSTLLTVALGGVLYGNYVLWGDYLEIIAWAFLLSQALYAPQKILVARLKRLRDTPRLQLHHRKPRKKGSWLLKMVRCQLQGRIGSRRLPELPGALAQFLISYSFVGLTFFLFLSLLHRLVSWGYIVGFLVIVGATVELLIYLLNYRILWLWTPLISDESLIALLLAIGTLGSIALVILFLGIQSALELYEAVLRAIQWSSELVYAHEALLPVWQYSVEAGQNALGGLKGRYHGTPWWPVVDTLEVSISTGRNISTTHQLCRQQLAELYSNTTWWEPADTAVALMLGQKNFGQLLAGAYRLARTLLLETEHPPTLLAQYAVSLLSNPLQYLQTCLGFLASVLLLASNWGVQLVFFAYFLLVMLNSDDDMMGMGITMLVPCGPKGQQELAEALRSAVQGVFYLPIQLASLHATIMLATLKVFRMPNTYLVTSLVFVTSLLPLFTPVAVVFVICAAMTIPFWFGDSIMSLVKPMIIFAINACLFYSLDEQIYAEFERKRRVFSPLLTAFSMALGVASFGWKGVVIGPLLLCLLLVAARQRLQSEPDPTLMSPLLAAPPPPSQPASFTVEVALGSAQGKRYRVLVPAGAAWAEWGLAVQRQLRLAEAPAEMEAEGGTLVNSTDVLVPGELLVLPAAVQKSGGGRRRRHPPSPTPD
eukprot:EG_transcript_3105